MPFFGSYQEISAVIRLWPGDVCKGDDFMHWLTTSVEKFFTRRCDGKEITRFDGKNIVIVNY